VVATAFFQIQEVKRLLTRTKQEVVALVIKPHLNKLIQIAQFPQGTSAALVCFSESCASEVMTVGSGLVYFGLNWLYTISQRHGIINHANCRIGLV